MCAPSSRENLPSGPQRAGEDSLRPSNRKEEIRASPGECSGLDLKGNHSPKTVTSPSRTRARSRGVESLTIVADLANRSKHFELTFRDRHGARVGGRKTLLEVSETVTFGPGHPDVQVVPVNVTHDWSIKLDDGRSRWALDLAQQAVDDWKRLLKAWSLPT